MTVLIVLALVIIALLIDYAVQLRHTKAVVSAPAADTKFNALSDLFLPEGVFVVPGHLWSVLLPSGKVKIGIDRLVGNLIGTPDEILLPQNGAKISRGDIFLTVKQGKRTLRFTAPMDGIVTDVNDGLSAQPDRISRNVDQAWAISLRPSNLATAIRNWRLGDDAKAWLTSELTRMRDFFSLATAQPALADTLQDGGMLAMGLLQQFDDSHWRHFENEFLCDAHEKTGEPRV